MMPRGRARGRVTSVAPVALLVLVAQLGAVLSGVSLLAPAAAQEPELAVRADLSCPPPYGWIADHASPAAGALVGLPSPLPERAPGAPGLGSVTRPLRDAVDEAARLVGTSFAGGATDQVYTVGFSASAAPLIWSPGDAFGPGQVELVDPRINIINVRVAAEDYTEFKGVVDGARHVKYCELARERSYDPVQGQSLAGQMPLPDIDVSASVEVVGPVPQVSASLGAAQPMGDPGAAQQWALQKIGASQAWGTGYGTTNRLICFVDTGVAQGHPDLSLGRFLGAVDLSGFPVSGDASPDGHGTHVTGTAVAITNNEVGISGLAQVLYMHVRAWSAQGQANSGEVAAGITMCAQNGAHVINVGRYGPDFSQAEEDAVAYASQALVVAPAGNGALVQYPAALPGAMAVGCSDAQDQVCEGTATGAALELLAPGKDIYSTVPGGYAYATGTTMAAAQVAGVAALIWSENPDLTTGQVREFLWCSATDLGDAGHDDLSGHGRLAAGQAMQRAVSGTCPCGQSTPVVSGSKAEGMEVPEHIPLDWWDEAKDHDGYYGPVTVTLDLGRGRAVSGIELDFEVVQANMNPHPSADIVQELGEPKWKVLGHGTTLYRMFVTVHTVCAEDIYIGSLEMFDLDWYQFN